MILGNIHLSSGVGRQLFFAFFVVSLFSFASAVVAGIGLGFVRNEQNTIIDDVYPTVRNAQSIAVEATALSVQLPGLFESRSVDELNDRAQAVRDRETRIKTFLESLQSADETGIQPRLAALVASLEDEAVISEELVRNTLELESAARSEVAQLLDLSDQIVDAAKDALLILGEKTIAESDGIRGSLELDTPDDRGKAPEVFDQFVRLNLVSLENISDLQFRAESIRDDLVGFSNIAVRERVKRLQEQIVLNVRAVTNIVVRLSDKSIQKSFTEPVSQFAKQIYGPDNIFEIQESALENQIRMLDIRRSAEEKGNQISRLVQDYVEDAKIILDGKNQSVQETTSTIQLILFAISISAIGVSAIIYIFYINNNIIRRLARLSGAVDQLAIGQLSTEVLSYGNDQITRLEEAVEGLRTKSIQLRDAERALIDYSNDLERSNNDLQQFAYVTAHDLRAPLRGLDSLSTWIEEDIEAGNLDDVSNNVVRLRSRVARMGALLNGILLYSRAGQENEVPEKIDFVETANEIFGDLENSDRFELDVTTDTKTVFTERSFLQQVLGNLIANAIKHHDKSRGRINVSLEHDSENNTLRVCDDGPGIPEDLRERVFQMFQTLKPRDEVEASGIGLALVKRLADRRKGRVFIEDSSLGGTCFVFIWPTTEEA